jgi:hypothetical protein
MFENVRTQDEMPSGTDPSKAKNYNNYSFGVAYLPIPAVSLKLDHKHQVTEANTSSDTVYLGMAYMY